MLPQRSQLENARTFVADYAVCRFFQICAGGFQTRSEIIKQAADP
jgi:hypothetical protein